MNSLPVKNCQGRFFRHWLSTALFSAALVGCASSPMNSASQSVQPAVPMSIASSQEKLSPEEQQKIDKWGIKILSVRPTAAGYMLDLRYRVLNAKKAAVLVNRKTEAYVIVEKDGSKLKVPVTSKLGAIRSTSQYAKENRNYFVFFANPGNHVKSGDKVTLVIGDFKEEHIKVL